VVEDEEHAKGHDCNKAKHEVDVAPVVHG
jgi:hypothetical protein